MKTVKDQTKIAYLNRRSIQQLSSEQKTDILTKIATTLCSQTEYILSQNNIDIEKGKSLGINPALLDRLSLKSSRIKQISDSILEIASFEDPVGEVIESFTRPNKLFIQKIRVPLGCIGMIYEARPNVTADAISIAIKTNNAIVLRGSQSAYNTNLAITKVFKSCIETQFKNAEFIQLLEDTSRESVKDFVQLNQYLDLIIPRGGASLIQSVVSSSTVPTIETGVGNCHVYVDKDANIQKAISISHNAKTQRPSVCNACETILVHKDIAKDFLPQLSKLLTKDSVLIKGCKSTQSILPRSVAASEKDWHTEYLDLTIAIKIVDSIDDAINHIDEYGTFHTEVIISENKDTINRFFKSIDASTVVANASSRFTDGGEFGFGAEIGISTQKLHARGPMGFKELTSYKYIVSGNGQIRT